MSDVTASDFRYAAQTYMADANLRALLLAAAEQREQLDRIMASSTPTGGKEFLAGWKKGYAEGTEQIATLTAERDALTAANKSLDAHCMVLQHDIRTCLAESDDAPREQLLGELSQQVVDLGLWNASQREQIATLTAERDEVQSELNAANVLCRLNADMCEKAETERDTARAEVVTLDRENSTLRAERDEARATLAKVQEEQCSCEIDRYDFDCPKHGQEEK